MYIEAMMNELPIAKALLVCERVDVDPLNRRLTFVNRTTRYRAATLPSSPTRWSVFAALINGFGSIELTLKLQHLETDQLIVNCTTEQEFVDRLVEVSFLITLRGIVFSVAGTYEFTLFAEDEPLSRYALRLSGPSIGG